MPQILASADIGSNTVHLLVAEAENGTMGRIGDINEWISLGEVVSRQGKIPPAVADRLIKTLDAFRKQAAALGSTGIYVFATEAIRKASNSAQILQAIRTSTGLNVEIITGQREAELGLRGAWLDCSGEGEFIMAEVGGGSAQVACCDSTGDSPRIRVESSLPIGTGSIIAKMGLDGPCDTAQYDRLHDYVDLALSAVPECPAERVIACGGVARGLWRAIHPDGDRQIALEELDYLIWSTRQLTLDVIIDRFMVKPKRAATLLPGAVVYRSVMQKFGVERMVVSRFGVREGAILDMASGAIKPSRV